MEFDIDQLEAYTARCAPGYDGSVVLRAFVVCQFFPLYLSIAIFALTVTLKYREVYYTLLSFGIWINWLVNLVLRWVIATPHVAGAHPYGCRRASNMPSWHAQNVFFFYVIVLSYVLWRRARMGIGNLFLIGTAPAWVCAARIVLGYDTFGDAAIGSTIGTLVGSAYQVFVMCIVRPRMSRILAWSVCRWLDCRDNLLSVDVDSDSVETPRFTHQDRSREMGPEGELIGRRASSRDRGNRTPVLPHILSL